MADRIASPKADLRFIDNYFLFMFILTIRNLQSHFKVMLALLQSKKHSRNYLQGHSEHSATETQSHSNQSMEQSIYIGCCQKRKMQVDR